MHLGSHLTRDSTCYKMRTYTFYVCLSLLLFVSLLLTLIASRYLPGSRVFSFTKIDIDQPSQLLTQRDNVTREYIRTFVPLRALDPCCPPRSGSTDEEHEERCRHVRRSAYFRPCCSSHPAAELWTDARADVETIRSPVSPERFLKSVRGTLRWSDSSAFSNRADLGSAVTTLDLAPFLRRENASRIQSEDA